MMDCTRVRDLEFPELYLGPSSQPERFAWAPGAATSPLPAVPALREDLAHLMAACRDGHKTAPPGIDFKVSHDGVAYRVAAMQAQGGTVFVLRKVAATVRSLGELGIPLAYRQHLLRSDLSGLFVVSGAIGSGKTMTACAMVKDLLALHGGLAVTRENPIELPLEGTHGKGVCFQTEASDDAGDPAHSLRPFVRWGARIVLIDEIRDADTALEVLQASVNGQLIITTMLAESVVQTVAKLHALVQHRIAAIDARALLVEGLLGVLHQKLARDARPALETEFLFLKDASHVRATLRTGNYEQLKSDIQLQMASMIAGAAPLR
jgi:twitching motility protein PilT